MKLSAMIHRAVKGRDPKLAGKVDSICRFRLGMTYMETHRFVNEYESIPLAEWDELLRKSE